MPRKGATPPENRVTVWCADLDGEAARRVSGAGLLSAEERRRAGRLVGVKGRRRWIAARSILRAILGERLEVDPADLRLESGTHGRPFLADSPDPALDFNLSHSGSLMLVALGRPGPIGVDIERVRSGSAAERVARRHFPEAEAVALSALPEARRARAFHRAWAAREAWVKARGERILRHLSRVEVRVDPDASPAFLSVDGCPNAAAGWHLEEVPVGEEYAAVVAREGLPPASFVIEWA